MNEKRIQYLLDEKKLKRRSVDKFLIISLLSSAEENTKAIEIVKLSPITATMVFKEIYDAIRQIGDAKWLLMGYEPFGHDISIELIMEGNDISFGNLDLFRRLRNDANYRGYRISLEQAIEIVSFWKNHGKALLAKVKKDASKM